MLHFRKSNATGRGAAVAATAAVFALVLSGCGSSDTGDGPAGAVDLVLSEEEITLLDASEFDGGEAA